MTGNLIASPARIGADLDVLAAITEPDRPYTRRAFSPLFLEGRRYLASAFERAGLSTRIDAAGNLIGHCAGRVAGRGTIMLGSHSDTVPSGGRFDGVAGVVAALEVARALKDRGIHLAHDLEIVDFLAEEVSIFGVSCIGSRGLIGERPADWLSRTAGELNLAEGIRQVGGRPEVEDRRDDIRAFLELHIEQGPVLEERRLNVGIVTAIVGISRIEIVVVGRADHAGTTPMASRRDALTAAAHLVLDIQGLAVDLAGGTYHFAATVGEFEMWPNAANVVPDRIRLLVDIRSERRDDLFAFRAGLTSAIGHIAGETGVEITERQISDNSPTAMDQTVMAALEAGAETIGASHCRMASGAGHDAAFLAGITRSGMVFVPCLGGRSHAPEEWAESHDIAIGTTVLLEAVVRLDAELGS